MLKATAFVSTFGIIILASGSTNSVHQKCGLVTTDTSYGEVQGECYRTASEMDVQVYRGIPYAKPPIGQLQFQKSQPPTFWHETKPTAAWPSRCIQSWILGKILPQFNNDSQDCLYLNVFAPMEKDVSDEFQNGYPVMVYIHGGGYHFGSSVEYGLFGIIDHIVFKNVVFITIQYRLGVYGFFTTGDSAAAGNYGLWDQTAALRWVQENIAFFNGNPNKVTVFGESAGGTSTSLLSISPHSNGLFHQAILMSGTHRASWAVNSGPVRYSEYLAKELGCKSESSSGIVDCIKSKDPAEIAEAEKVVIEGAKFESQILFNPVYDQDFFSEPLDKLEKSAPKMPVISGTTKNEMAMIITPPIDEIKSTIEADQSSYSLNDFQLFINHVFSDTNFKNGPLVRRIALFHYLESRSNSCNTTSLIEQYMEVFNDLAMFYPQYADANRRFLSGSTVWLYSFDYFNPKAFPDDHKHKGVHHLMDLTYLFSVKLLKEFDFDSTDDEMRDLVTTLWTNFAKYGSPSANNTKLTKVSWEPVSAKFPGQYLSLKPQPEMMPVYHKEGVAFWSLIADIEKFHIDPLQSRDTHDEL